MIVLNFGTYAQQENDNQRSGMRGRRGGGNCNKSRGQGQGQNEGQSQRGQDRGGQNSQRQRPRQQFADQNYQGASNNDSFNSGGEEFY